MPATKLKQQLDLVDSVFDTGEILSLRPDKQYIKKYYKANKLAYTLFHTDMGIIHMGISRDGVYKDDDLLEAARIVEAHLKRLKATSILELATGRGGTSLWLAAKYPSITFNGIDLSRGQLVYTQKQAKKQSNFHPLEGDYHDLSQYKDKSMDIVFVIEALCYSRERDEVFSEVKRVLNNNGVFIVLDAYSLRSRSKMSDDELRACRLTELGMAVEKFDDYPALLDDGKHAGFTVKSSENVSDYILPTLYRFERLAKKFFKRPRLAKTITRISSKELTYNAISGLLMPALIKNKLACYYITIFEKID